VKCARCRRLLPALSEGALRPRRAHAVADHLSECSACRNLAGEQRRLTEAMAACAPPALDPALRARVLARALPLVPEAPRPRWSWRPQGVWAWAPATALFLVLVVGYWLTNHRATPRTAAVASVVVGEVEQRPSEIASWQPVHVGDEIPAGAQILSHEHGMVTLETTSGTTVSIAPQSAVALQGPSEIAPERGRLMTHARPGLRIVTPAGRIVAHSEGSRIALAVDGSVTVAVTGGEATWVSPSGDVPLPANQVSALNPTAMSASRTSWDRASWSWLAELEQARARQLLGETHPSLLPGLDEGRR
jgi:hypothetical protein